MDGVRGDGAAISMLASLAQSRRIRLPLPRVPGQNDHVPKDAGEEARTARWVWTILRGTVEKLAMPGEEQVKDPEIDECSDWDPGYLMVDHCQSVGWVSPSLRVLLDSMDALLDRLSDDPRFWSDASIVGDPLWDQVRCASKEAASLMPSDPWNARTAGPEAVGEETVPTPVVPLACHQPW